MAMADLHILVNTIHSPSILNSSAAASWLPVCLPKFNSSAFVNAYVMFLPRADGQDTPRIPTSPKGSVGTPSPDPDAEETQQTDDASSGQSMPVGIAAGGGAEVGLVCVSGNADFEAVRGWCETVSQVSPFWFSRSRTVVTTECFMQRLASDGLLKALSKAIIQGDTEYSVSSLGVPGLRHFVYKSRSHVQITMPTYEEPYDSLNEKRRYVSLQIDGIHESSD